MIVPSGGAEPDYYGFERAAAGRIRFYLTVSPVAGELGRDHDPDALKQTGRPDWLVEAAGRIGDCRLDAIEWACTSGSFVLGRRFAEEQAAAISAAVGAPAGSTSLAFTRACDAMGASRVAILATYPENVARLFVDFLAEFGIATVALHALGILSGWEAARLGERTIACEAARLATSGADAILVPDTALPTLHFLAGLESQLGLPILSANAVTVWDAMRLARAPWTLPGYGRLLSGDR